MQWTGQKKLVLNTGVPHCYVERKSLAVWHIYVAHERRVTVRREVRQQLDPLPHPRGLRMWKRVRHSSVDGVDRSCIPWVRWSKRHVT